MIPFLLYYLLIILVCGGMYFSKSIKIQQVLLLPFLIVQVWFTLFCANNVDAIKTSVFRIEKIAIIFIIVLTILTFATVLFILFSFLRKKETQQSVAIQNSALVFFICMLTSAMIAGDFGWLLIFLQAAVLALALLIYKEDSTNNYNVAKKYFLANTMGFALILIGFLFIGTSEKFMPDMDLLRIKFSFLFILTGLSVMIGSAPLFVVKRDALHVLPFYLLAIVSGGTTIAGFVALFRVYELFSISSMLIYWMDTILRIVGILSALLAIISILQSRDYKRLLSNVSTFNAGFMLIALASVHTGSIAAILQLICFVFINAVLFFQFETIQLSNQPEEPAATENYFSRYPAEGTIILLAFLMLIAIPPSGLFISEFLLVKTLFVRGKWWVLIPLIILLIIMTGSIVRNFMALLYQPILETKVLTKKKYSYEMIPSILLLLLVAWMGINPPVQVVQYIEQTVRHFSIYN